MTIRIECEASELAELLRDRESQAERIGTLEARCQRVYDLEDEVRSLKSERDNLTKPAAIPVQPNQLRALIMAIASNAKIAAIKEVRSMTGLGLKEAKDLVEEAIAAGTGSCKDCHAVKGAAHMEWCQHRQVG